MKTLKIIYVLVFVSMLAIGCGSGSSDPDPNSNTNDSSSTNSNSSDNGGINGDSDSGTNTDGSGGSDNGTNTDGEDSGGNIACNDDNHIDQPDLTGNPYWSTSSASIGSEVMLNVPVDEDTDYVNVVLHHTQNEGGSWIATGGGGFMSITPGQARIVSIAFDINFLGFTPLAGNYFPTISLCKRFEECFDGQNIHYAGSDTLINNGDQYVRIYNESSENIDVQTSCFLIPIISVTE